jgi:hypothetical protein
MADLFAARDPLLAFLEWCMMAMLAQCSSEWRTTVRAHLAHTSSICLDGTNLITTTEASRQARREREPAAAQALTACENLRSIVLKDLWRLRDDNVRSIVESCPLLVDFRCDACVRLTDASLQALAGLGHICRVDLGGSPSLTDVGVIDLVISRGSQLESLVFFDSYHFSDQVLRAIGRHCPRLQQASFGDREGFHNDAPYNFTDEGVRALAEGCSALRHVDLRQHSKVGDVGVAALAMHCPRLEEVDLADSCITDSGLENLLKRRALKTLSLWGCKSVTDGGLEAIVRHGRSLTHLDISFCSSVTLQGIDQLEAGCKGLKHLDKYDAGPLPEVTEEQLQRIMAAGPPPVLADYI